MDIPIPVTGLFWYSGMTCRRLPYHMYELQPLKRVEAERDLGVLITCDARLNEHIYAQVNKAKKMLGFIRRSLSSRSDQFLPTFRSLYVAIVRSHLEYASETWSPKFVTLIKLIEGVQRHATRLLLPNLTYNERLQQLNLLPLVYQREVKDNNIL